MHLDNKTPEPEWRKSGKWMVASCRNPWMWDAAVEGGGSAQKYFAGGNLPNHPGGRCVRAASSESRGRVTPIARSRFGSAFL
jgi:hypothetical protein